MVALRVLPSAPSTDAVMVASPMLLPAVTMAPAVPSAFVSTAAISALSLVQVTFLPTSESARIAVTSTVPPGSTEASLRDMTMPTSSETAATVTVASALTSGLMAEAAVMVALPLATAVTLPFWPTVATDSSELDHTRFFSVESSGSTVAVSCVCWPGANASSVLSSVTDSAAMGVTTTEAG